MAAVQQTRLDFAWVIAYVAVLAAAAALWADCHRRLGLDLMAALGIAMIAASILAGTLDWIENFLMLSTIRRLATVAGPVGLRAVTVTRRVAFAKFGLAFLATIYCFVLSPLTLLLWWLICDCSRAAASA